MLDALRQGDPRTWQAFCQDHAGLVLHVVRQTFARYDVGGDAHDIEDVGQEVFIRLSKQDFALLKRFDPARAKLTTGMGPRLATALRQATNRNALFLVREIQRGNRSQAPGGQAFVKLAASTIERKGSSKALIDTGFLVNAITQKIMADEGVGALFKGFVANAFRTVGAALVLVLYDKTKQMLDL